MAIQNSVAVRNGRLNSDEAIIGTSPKLRLLTGSMPANCAAAQTGTLIAEMALPSDWMGAASAGAMSKLGTWQDLIADNSGTPTYYRLVDNAGTTCHEQGTVGQGTGDLSLDNTTIVAGQQVIINSWDRTAGGA